MTTKIKIIAGFTFMVILLAAVSTIAYRDLQGTSTDFKEYDRLAKFNAATSDLTTDLNAVESDIYKYLDDKKKEHMDRARKNLELVEQKIRECVAVVSRAESRAILEQLSANTRELRGMQEKIASTVNDAYKQYMEVVNPSGMELGKKLVSIAEQAKTVNSSEVALAVSQAQEDLAGTRALMSRFAETRIPSDAQRASDLLKALRASLGNVNPKTERGLALKAEIDRAFTGLVSAYNIMRDKFTDSEQSLETVRSLMDKMTSSALKLSADVDALAQDKGKKMLEKTATAQKELMLTSAFGLLTGIACAIFIVLGIIRVLREMSGFAGAVARGDFKYQIKVQEKGEIGAMVTAMRDIPNTLENVIGQARTLANHISSGHMRERLDASKLPGTFSEIATSTNAVGDAYLNLIDAMELPIMAGDMSNTLLFVNKAGQNVLGGNKINQKCSDLFKSPACNTSECYGLCSANKNAAHSGETTVNISGKQLNIAVNSLPLHDLNNKVVGYVEVITDLTAIRTQQAAVMKAVAQASEISDRVAAASEELAAQVEQISRGAERQRSRVESTAGAMSEMNSTVLEVARNAGQASEQTEDTRKRAENGAALVNRVVQSINTVNTVAGHLQTNMRELGQQAESIGGVMNVISDIADQTNLLALNAAIEAARAGDAGRGFAVVADEVRKLAENTMRATQEVGANITAIQNSARMNIDEVGNAAKSVTEATDLANSSGAALKEIVDLAAANSAIVTSIATAAEEQSATSEEINLAVEEISRITNETSDGMVQSSSAVQDLSRMAQELRRVMETLR